MTGRSKRSDQQQAQDAEQPEEQATTRAAPREAGEQQGEGAGQPENHDVAVRQRGEARRANGERRPARAGRARPSSRYHFDPCAEARAALLSMAWTWNELGQPYSAIYAYTQVLERYPGTAAASVAAEDLLEIAHQMVEQCKFYTALNIFERLEECCEPDAWSGRRN